MKDIEKIKSEYLKYGYKEFKHDIKNGFLSYLYTTGPFRNIEIIRLKAESNTNEFELELKRSGYNTLVIDKHNATNERLFNSFFHVQDYREKIKFDYQSYTESISDKYSNVYSYEYLKAPYIIDGSVGELDIPQEIISRLNTPKPILFVIEAAAGFGKTSSAYELASQINTISDKIPLLAELSKNRQARIFKHILLDEIDKSFLGLTSGLVKSEIEDGKIITILDGFDELLKDDNKNESDFVSKEPMLETIGDFLHGAAKIILTTRRTMLFDGDDFHTWAEKNNSNFQLVKIQINEPLVTDWLNRERHDMLQQANIEIDSIANPVMLSFLRYVSIERLHEIFSSPESLVDNYFGFILEREQNRQDLKMSASKQNEIIDIVASDMILNDYRSEDRSYIVELIKNEGDELIEECIEKYTSVERPTTDAISNKLASHAFFDRSSRNPTKIEFINEFVFGHYVSRFLSKNTDWISDDWKIIGPAVLSFRTRSKENRIKLWERLKPSLDFVTPSNKISAAIELLQSIPFEIENSEVNSLNFNKILLGENNITNSQFNDCQFSNCTFNLSSIGDVTFFSCRFYNCVIVNGNMQLGGIHTPGSSSDNDLIQQFHSRKEQENDFKDEDISIIDRAERAVLEKFWPVGKETMPHKHRPIRGICIYSDSGHITPDEMYDAIQSLKKKDILRSGKSSTIAEINLSEIVEIRKILGR
ncbi:NACHT domain-containing protein [Aeromonas veronii]|uniref:NACHT domain-containing protein n=1 Tax=Aeromonas veronii TaxID=654 RepID=UPI0040559389